VPSSPHPTAVWAPCVHTRPVTCSGGNAKRPGFTGDGPGTVERVAMVDGVTVASESDNLGPRMRSGPRVSTSCSTVTSSTSASASALEPTRRATRAARG
jgi:hypothetical protein